MITGAGSGIGRALATRLAAQGARLALSDSDGEAAAGTARLCEQAGARAGAARVDVTDRAAVLAHTDAVWEEFGRVDMLCCAAGVIHTGSLLDSALPDLERVLAVNLWGTVTTVKAFLPRLLASGGGQVVIMSSGLGLLAAPRYSAYSASKFALRGFSESLRQEMRLGGHPVTVTCAYPGGVRTPIMRNGTFAATEDPAAVTAVFEGQIARTGADRAARLILRGAGRGQAKVLVGADARLLWLAERVAGSTYQDIAPWLARFRRRAPAARQSASPPADPG